MAEPGVANLGAAQIAAHEKHASEAMPAHVQEIAANAQNQGAGLNPATFGHHEAPMKMYGVDPRDQEIQQKLILNQFAQAGGLLPQMISDNKDIASWVAEKTKIAEAEQWINELLTFYDQTDLNSKRWFDAKFPFIKQMKLKRIREVGNMHIRLAELCENADPSPDEVKYIIDLLHGKAALPPTLLPKEIHDKLPAAGIPADAAHFYQGMFNPFRFTNPIDKKQKDDVIKALGTNVLGKGFIERWNKGHTIAGPQNLKDWTEYFLTRATSDKYDHTPLFQATGQGGNVPAKWGGSKFYGLRTLSNYI